MITDMMTGNMFDVVSAPFAVSAYCTVWLFYFYRSSYRGGDSYGYGRGGDSFSSGGIGGNLRNIQWDLSKLPVFEKNFYFEHPAVKNRSEQDDISWRREHDITVIGKGVPKPCLTFEEASMPSFILSEVLKQGFSKRKFLVVNGLLRWYVVISTY